jgi:HEAT repeats
MTENGNSPSISITTPVAPRRRATSPIVILALLFAIATFLTWYFTWFGRELSDTDISKYLSDEAHPRHIQHALLQIQQRLERGDSTAHQWYPRIIALAGNPETEFRITAAWVMGYDTSSEEFHKALLKLLADSEPLVRRNAALALVRFGDASGHEELIATLKPYAVTAPSDGVISSTLNEGSPVSRSTLVARVKRADNGIQEIRSPLPGKIETISTRDGASLHAGDTVATISSDANSVWEVLRGLALIGREEDLPEIRRYARGVDSLPDRIKEQANAAAKIIETRSRKGR